MLVIKTSFVREISDCNLHMDPDHGGHEQAIKSMTNILTTTCARSNLKDLLG